VVTRFLNYVRGNLYIVRMTTLSQTSAPHPPEKPVASELGHLLRHWRAARGKSQLALSLDSGVSQRHISFIESGRSTPGRTTLLDLAEALAVPLRERNALLLAAGYAPAYSEAAWDADDMRGIQRALDRMLVQHNPYPAVVMDRDWNVLATNESAPQFFNHFIDMGARKGPRNILHLMFDPAGMRPFIVDWERVARCLLQRVVRESAGQVIDDATRALMVALRAYPGAEAAWQTPAPELPSGAMLPMIPIGFAKDGVVLNYFSMVSTVGTPQTVAAQELRGECMFPADDATEHHHAVLMATEAGHAVGRRATP
jgi:transcriptional regulator with XRE-family HTH domain